MPNKGNNKIKKEINMVSVSHDQQYGASKSAPIGGKAGCQRETKSKPKAEIVTLDTSSIRTPKAAQNNSSSSASPDAELVELIKKLIKKYEDSKLKNAEAFIKQNIEQMVDKMNLTTEDASQVKELLNQATSGNVNTAGDANGTPEHHVGNFFLILFEYLKKNTRSNNQEMLATFDHMQAVSKNLSNVAVELEKSQQDTESKITKANAEEKKKHRHGLLGIILSVVAAIVLAVVTAGVGGVLSGAAAGAEVAAEVTDATAVGMETGDVAMTAVGESVAEGIAETSIDSAVMDGAVDSTVDGIATTAENATEGAVEGVEDSIEDAVEGSEATTESSSETSNATKFLQGMKKFLWNKYAFMAATTVAGVEAGVGTAVLSGATNTRNSDVQQYLSEQQAVSQLESNKSDTNNSLLTQDNQIIQQATTNDSTNTSMQGQATQAMTQAQRIGSI